MWYRQSALSVTLKVVGGGGEVRMSEAQQRQQARDIDPRQHLCGQHEASVFMVL